MVALSAYSKVKMIITKRKQVYTVGYDVLREQLVTPLNLNTWHYLLGEFRYGYTPLLSITAMSLNA